MLVWATIAHISEWAHFCSAVGSVARVARVALISQSSGAANAANQSRIATSQDSRRQVITAHRSAHARQAVATLRLAVVAVRYEQTTLHQCPCQGPRIKARTHF